MTFPDPTVTLHEQPEGALLALTVLGEAEGESPEGKAAVAHVVVNRMRQKARGVSDVALAPWQFSCWNAGTSRAQFLADTLAKAAANIPMGMWAACWTAAHEALTGQSADPTSGASHYCTNNLWAVDDTEKRRPRWHSIQEIAAGNTVRTARLGGHTFAVAAPYKQAIVREPIA